MRLLDGLEPTLLAQLRGILRVDTFDRLFGALIALLHDGRELSEPLLDADAAALDRTLMLTLTADTIVILGQVAQARRRGSMLEQVGVGNGEGRVAWLSVAQSSGPVRLLEFHLVR